MSDIVFEQKEIPNELKPILKEMSNFGYEFYGKNCKYFDYKDMFNGVFILSDERAGIGVRIAVSSIFDRWANSGIEKWFTSTKEVIEYLCSKKCFLEAMGEFFDESIDAMLKWNDSQFLEEYIAMLTVLYDEMSL